MGHQHGWSRLFRVHYYKEQISSWLVQQSGTYVRYSFGNLTAICGFNHQERYLKALFRVVTSIRGLALVPNHLQICTVYCTVHCLASHLPGRLEVWVKRSLSTIVWRHWSRQCYEFCSRTRQSLHSRDRIWTLKLARGWCEGQHTPRIFDIRHLVALRLIENWSSSWSKYLQVQRLADHHVSWTLWPHKYDLWRIEDGIWQCRSVLPDNRQSDVLLFWPGLNNVCKQTHLKCVSGLILKRMMATDGQLAVSSVYLFMQFCRAWSLIRIPLWARRRVRTEMPGGDSDSDPLLTRPRSHKQIFHSSQTQSVFNIDPGWTMVPLAALCIVRSGMINVLVCVFLM